MLRREVSRLTAALVLLLSSSTATPEESEPAKGAEAEEGPEGRTVTGTRIRRSDAATPWPMIVIGRDEIMASGKVSLGEFLQTLPEQGNAINTGVNFGGDGSTRVNLRGIGTSRTLVLVNGRRWMPGSAGADGSVDLSSIPSAAVERIEVLKGGASAVYGSDAVAGVVNVLTRRGGGPTDAFVHTGASGRGDGTTVDLGLTTGARSAVGGLVLSAGYFDQLKVKAADRGFSRFQYFYDANLGRYIAASGTVPAGRTLVAGATGTGNTLWNDLVAAGGDSFIWDPGPAGAGYDGSTVYCGASAGRTECFRRYAGDGLRAVGQVGDGYNHRAESDLVTPQRRFEAFATGDLALGSIARAFVEAAYVNRRSSQQLAAEPLVLEGENVYVSRDNAYNPFGLDVFVRRRLLELGPREARQNVDAYRVVAGLEGTIPDGIGALRGWSWDVSATYGRTEGTSTSRNALYLPALAAALGPSFIAGQDANGRNVYRCGNSLGNEIVGCVPLDLFGGPGSITPEQLAGLTFTRKSQGFDELRSLQANASGAPFSIVPTRPVGLSLGYEHRELSGEYVNDLVSARGLTTGPRPLDTRGSYSVNEVHGEIAIPLAAGIPGAHELEASAAARWFDYSTFGSDSTYQLGARWRPVADVAIRATHSTAFRAPTLQESYGGLSDAYPTARDPCRGPSVGGPPLSSSCLASGIPATGTGDTSTRVHTVVGGNPGVGPETSRGYTVGVLLEPRWARNLAVSVDYHAIEIDETIGPIGADLLLAGCYSGTNPEYCSRIVRNPVTHFIEVVNGVNGNFGKLATAGVDFSVRYAIPTPGAGRFGFSLDATWLQRIDQTLPDGTVIHGKNTFDLNALNSPFGGAGGTFPSWKANARVTWGMGGVSSGISTRFLGSFHECGDYLGDFSGGGFCYWDSRYQRTVAAYHTEDVFLAYAFSSRAGRTSLTAGVLNACDVTPAKIYNGITASTDPYNYDQIGRFFYVRLEQRY